MQRITLALASALLLLSSPAQAEFQEDYTFAADELTVGNLVGEIRLEGHGGSDFLVEVSVEGEDAERDLVEFDVQEGDRAELWVLFPLGEHSRYVYPPLGRSKSSFSGTRDRRHRDWIDGLMREHRGKVEFRGGGRGLEMWADVTIKVPEGKVLTVFAGVAEVLASNIKGELNTWVRSGRIEVEKIEGPTSLHTGSGSVVADGIDGDLEVNTGSGSIEASNLASEEVELATGSGHVNLDHSESEALDIRTGSGTIVAESVRGIDISMRTGSGGIKTMDVHADSVEASTGSGAITLDLLHVGAGPYFVGTSSGSIRLELPSEVSAEVMASTGSGRVRATVTDAEVHRKRKNEMEFTLGSGDAQVDLQTNSGSIRIHQR